MLRQVSLAAPRVSHEFQNFGSQDTGPGNSLGSNLGRWESEVRQRRHGEGKRRTQESGDLAFALVSVHCDSGGSPNQPWACSPACFGRFPGHAWSGTLRGSGEVLRSHVPRWAGVTGAVGPECPERGNGVTPVDRMRDPRVPGPAGCEQEQKASPTAPQLQGLQRRSLWTLSDASPFSLIF